MRKIYIVGILILGLAALSIMTLSSASSKPASLNGVWKSDNPPMAVYISDNSIKITIVGEQFNALYWKGTFPKTVFDGAKVISAGDTELMDQAVMGSTLDSKEFMYKDGKLIFTFTWLEVTKTVYLSR